MSSAAGKSKFALFFGNRGFFPSSLMATAREELEKTLKSLGHETIMLDAGATRHGAVETPAEGKIYADFLKARAGEYDGVILCLPNFGDENGALAALKDANVPIYIQACPDELDKMSPQSRRDAFCGKLSIMDVFYQNGIKFTTLKPHTVAIGSKDFAENIDHFDRVCSVVKGIRNMVVGMIGARTSAFKTVRFDELALQKHGITAETFDLSDVFARMRNVHDSDQAYRIKAEVLNNYSDFSDTPASSFHKLVQLAVTLDCLIEEFQLDAIALRCWIELQQQLDISPCVILSELNNRLIASACETDVCNAVTMRALSMASKNPAACLDWNNNYGDDEDKCILFHCGQVPHSMMSSRSKVTEHRILENAVGKGCGFGCNVGRIKPAPFTFGSMMTEAGNLKFYLGEGEFTNDPIPNDFFGCAGVAKIPALQDVLLSIGKNGHRHHVSVTPGHVSIAVREALEYYLGSQVAATL